MYSGLSSGSSTSSSYCFHEDKLPAYAFYFFSAVLIPRIEYGVQCLKIELKSPVKMFSATIHFKGELFTRFAARTIIASTPNVVRNRRSKPPTFSSKNNFLRFVGKTPFIKPLYHRFLQMLFIFSGIIKFSIDSAGS